MGHHSIEHVRQEVRRFMLVGLALLIGTAVTVLVAFFDFGHDSINIAVALAIATAKGFLVAGYFMHLISEKKLIYGMLIATVFFFTGLMYLILWSLEPGSLIHIK